MKIDWGIKLIKLIPQKGYSSTYIGPTGTAHSYDPKLGQVPSVRHAEALDALKMINTALNVANLAVGIYTAYQVTKVRQELQQGISEVKGILSAQSRKLDLILSAQAEANEKLDLILLRVETGFERIEDAVRDVTLTRRSDELEKAMRGLFLVQQRLADELAAEAPIDDELTSLEAAAKELLLCVDTALHRGDLPAEGRQPLVLAGVSAIVAETDAWLLRNDEEATRGKAARALRRASDQIRDEARRLHNGATPWDVVRYVGGQASIYRAILAQLEARVSALEGAEASEDAAEFALYEPGDLKLLPDATNTDADIVELRTLDDYEWYVEVTGADRSAFDVSTVSHVDRCDLESALGADKTPLEVLALRDLVRPTRWAAYNDWTSSWLDDLEPIPLPHIDLPPPEPRRLVSRSGALPFRSGDRFEFKGPKRYWVGTYQLLVEGGEAQHRIVVRARGDNRDFIFRKRGPPEDGAEGAKELKLMLLTKHALDDDGKVRELWLHWAAGERVKAQFRYMNDMTSKLRLPRFSGRFAYAATAARMKHSSCSIGLRLPADECRLTGL
jgi:hypothetical protein